MTNYQLDDGSTFIASGGATADLQADELAIAKLLIEAVRKANAGGFDLEVYPTHVVIHRRTE